MSTDAGLYFKFVPVTRYHSEQSSLHWFLLYIKKALDIPFLIWFCFSDELCADVYVMFSSTSWIPCAVGLEDIGMLLQNLEGSG